MLTVSVAPLKLESQSINGHGSNSDSRPPLSEQPNPTSRGSGKRARRDDDETETFGSMKKYMREDVDWGVVHNKTTALLMRAQQTHRPCPPMLPAASNRHCAQCTIQASAPTSVKCAFCAKDTCDHCLRTCEECHEPACGLCTVINYDMSEERAFCLECIDRNGSNVAGSSATR